MPSPTAPDRYRIESRLGSGGMGEVHRAYDTVLKRHIALKVLHEEDRAGEIDRKDHPHRDPFRELLREARLCASLQHHNIVTIFDVGTHEGTAFIAMELVEGKDLRVAAFHPEVTLQQKIEWVRAIASALEAAHAVKLVHRDIKPANVLVKADGTIKVLDFGIAKRTGGQKHETLGPTGPIFAGTPGYMAPEQKIGVLDERSDQFAWGILTYEILTGKRGPRDRPLAAEQIDSDLPSPIAPIVKKATSHRADDRFTSMSSLLAALDAACAVGKSKIIARPISTAADTIRDPHGQKAKPASDDDAVVVEGSGTTEVVVDEATATIRDNDAAQPARAHREQPPRDRAREVRSHVRLEGSARSRTGTSKSKIGLFLGSTVLSATLLALALYAGWVIRGGGAAPTTTTTTSPNEHDDSDDASPKRTVPPIQVAALDADTLPTKDASDLTLADIPDDKSVALPLSSSEPHSRPTTKPRPSASSSSSLTSASAAEPSSSTPQVARTPFALAKIPGPVGHVSIHHNIHTAYLDATEFRRWAAIVEPKLVACMNLPRDRCTGNLVVVHFRGDAKNVTSISVVLSDGTHENFSAGNLCVYPAAVNDCIKGAFASDPLNHKAQRGEMGSQFEVTLHLSP